MNPQEVVELLRRTGCVVAVVSVSMAKAQETQTLPPVVVTGRSANLVGVADSATEGTISARQLATRPLLRPAEVLESIPGLTVTQHSGDGKANQYFLRGFNLDHGSDFRIPRVGLFNTVRLVRTDTVRQDQLTETAIGLYGETRTQWLAWFRSTLGLRFNQLRATVSPLDGPFNAANAGSARGSQASRPGPNHRAAPDRRSRGRGPCVSPGPGAGAQ